MVLLYSYFDSEQDICKHTFYTQIYLYNCKIFFAKYVIKPCYVLYWSNHKPLADLFCFIFMQFSGKINQNNRLAPLPFEVRALRMGNPGSATGYNRYPDTLRCVILVFSCIYSLNLTFEKRSTKPRNL